MKTILRNILQGRVFQGAVVTVILNGIVRWLHVIPTGTIPFLHVIGIDMSWQRGVDSLVMAIVGLAIQQLVTPTDKPVLPAGKSVITSAGNAATVVVDKPVTKVTG